MSMSFEDLRVANAARQREWDPDDQITLVFRGNELGGECGETQNVIKKLERERIGIRGTRATTDDLASELADVVMCADLIGMQAGIDLGMAIARKFNETSEKYGLATRLTATADFPRSYSITRADPSSPILFVTDAGDIGIRAGTVVEIDFADVEFSEDAILTLGELTAGRDYGVGIDGNGRAYVALLGDGNPIDDGWIAGFHVAPGSCAEARAGGDATPAINPYSLWDLDFRPACPDPRGMALVDTPDGGHFWVDIYLLGVDHKDQGTSRFAVEIADGDTLDLLDYKTAVDIMAIHGKRLLTYYEFCTAAYGVTEKSSAARHPKTTGPDQARTSRFGLMQATGNLWIWGTDGDPDDPRPSIFGGSWFNGSGAGSRCATLDYWAESSCGFLSARGACDHLRPA